MSREKIAHFLIRVGEIGLKGENRNMFERKLKDNIKRRLKGVEARVSGTRGRYFVEVFSGDLQLVEQVLATTFGIVGFARVNAAEKNIDCIYREAESIVANIFKSQHGQQLTFKINAKRADKGFPMNSYEIASNLGERLLAAFPGIRVDVKNPDLKIQVEIRDQAFVWGPRTEGPGGLPVGCAGRGMLLLSGGIDSPVAGWMMAKRGMKLDAVYFHAYPYTSDEAKQKVVDLSRKIAPWNGGINLFVVPFTKPQLHIKEKAPKEATTLIMRAGMMRIAHMAAEERDGLSLITGEALSQVASQTAQSLRFTGSVTDLPILRPLIGMDKEEIIRIAQKIDTFETSILPYEDCCTIFSPKHPLVTPKYAKMREMWEKVDLEESLKEAFSNSERIFCPADGGEPMENKESL